MDAQSASAKQGLRARRPELFLIGLTILVISGFQAYWLKNSYDREKKALIQKTNIHFRETITGLQALNFRMLELNHDSGLHREVKFFGSPGEKSRIRIGRSDAVVGMFNALGKKLGDSLRSSESVKSTIVINDSRNKMIFRQDSTLTLQSDGPGNGLINILTIIDSLQDSLRTETVDSAYRALLKKEKVSVPFQIITYPDTTESLQKEWETEPPPAFGGRGPRMRLDLLEQNKVTIGFSHPRTYELVLGNTFPYLIQRIWMPILFSIFLIGVTMASLVFLYRNLLKQRRLTAMKNDFISNVTHELKTPIATVGVAIEALKNFNAMNDPARTREYLDISQNELNRLSMLVDKVLKLSMFENKELELRKEDFDLQQLTQEVVASFRLQMEKFQATCEITTEGNDFTLFADKMHITSVLYNLIDNALKYSPSAPRIEVKLEDKGEQLQLSVKDQGIGIPEAYQEKVFEKFFRVPAGDTHNVKGYGLGLSYVHEVAQRHGGKIDLQSESGKGTTFIITFPRHHG